MLSAARTVLAKQTAPIARRAYSDLSRVTLIGRLGADPISRVTSTGKPYFTYSVATQAGARNVDEQGNTIDPPTSWHTIFAFGENAHKILSSVGKGSTVYVEADLEMRSGGNGPDGIALPDRPLLRHQKINVINWVRPTEEGAEEGTASDVE